MRKIIIIIAALFITACGSETFEGGYVSKSSSDNPIAALFQQKLSFRSDGKVSVYVSGQQIGIFKYEKNGDEITLFRGDGTTQILTIEDDGSLFGGGQELVRLEENTN